MSSVEYELFTGMRVFREYTAPPEEANDDAPFGNYLFGNLRSDVDEENTDEEDDFVDALNNHMLQNDPGDLASMSSELVDLKNQGQYGKYLEPPKGKPVYRGIVVRPEIAEMLLGVDEFELTMNPGVAKVATDVSDYESEISSWTINPATTIEFIDRIMDFDDCVAIIFQADPGNGDFLLNPETLPAMANVGHNNTFAAMMKNEKEVVLTGKARVTKAAYMYFDIEHDERNIFETGRQLLKALGASS